MQRLQIPDARPADTDREALLRPSDKSILPGHGLEAQPTPAHEDKAARRPHAKEAV